MRQSRFRPWLLFVILFVLALGALLPMRLALGVAGLESTGLSARRVAGTIWAGQLEDAHFGEFVLGDVRADVSPLPLLAGRTGIRLAGRAPGSDAPLAGVVGVSRGSLSLEAVSAAVSARRAFAPLPLSRLGLEEVSVRFNGAVCAQASGRVRALLSGGVGAVALPAMMSGTARCEGGRLVLPLAGQAGTEAVTLRISGDGAYRAELVVQPGESLSAEQLALAGFQPVAGGYGLSLGGHF